jgi:hypothetical protein
MVRIMILKMELFKGAFQKTSYLIVLMTFIIVALSFQQQHIAHEVVGGSSTVLLASPFLHTAFADHGQEITLTLHNSSFGSLTSGDGNQVSVFAQYALNEDSIAGQTINAVMEVYAPNGSLIKTSSYPNGFVVQSSGGVEGLETTIKDPTVPSVTANVTFRNLDKTVMLSNDLRVDLNLAGGGTALTTAGEEEEGLGLESGAGQDTNPSVQTGQVGGSEADDTEDTEQDEEDWKDKFPLPLFGND